MSLLTELRARAWEILFPAFGIAAVVYFGYHGIEGERGLFAWRAMQQKLDVAQAELERVRGERETLERRVNLLYPQSLDPDMLDESARRLLNYGLPGEIVVLDRPAEAR